MTPTKTYCGLDWDGMNRVLDTVCRLQDDTMLTDEEMDALDIAVQCVTDVVNLLKGESVKLDGDFDEHR